ncbi:MAG: flagellin FliC [Deltaproteobacteria bacterium]|nr:flagellin FliC [Deltaproteobacteria bacterium]
MPLSYASNSSSLVAQRNLQSNTNKLSQTFARLSSGLRLNRAADGPADIQVADALRADSRTATVAIRNANDGLSLAYIADSALDEIGSALTRMTELATQSANGVYTNTQRSALQSEFESLGSEIERIAKTTEFNNLKLLSNSASVTLQVGLDGSTSSNFTIAAVLGTLNSVGLASNNSSKLIYSLTGNTDMAAQTASQLALDAVNSALGSITARRGIFGAAESRLSTAIDYLSVARENFVAAESRIRDADIAQEVANMVRLQVLQQAGTAVLAQANLQPSVAYSLLQT